jgi:predicted nucleic acid-binding protein
VNAYLDTSVILRVLFGEKNSLIAELEKVKLPVISQITRLECFRTIDRLHLRGQIEDEELVVARNKVLRLQAKCEIILLSDTLLNLAESSFSLPLGSLDSIHLASAILWRKKYQKPLSFLTHDQELSLAARSQGFEVIG